MFNRSKKKKKELAKKRAQEQAALEKKLEQERLELEPAELADGQIEADQVDLNEQDFDLDNMESFEDCELDEIECLDIDDLETEDLDQPDCDPNEQLQELELEVNSADNDLSEEQPELKVEETAPAVAVAECEPQTSQLDRSAQILENIEFLIALHEDSVENGTGQSAEAQDFSNLDSAFAEAIKHQTSDIESLFLEQNESLTQFFDEKLNNRFDQFEKQIKQISGEVQQSLKNVKNNESSNHTPSDWELVEKIESQQVKFDELLDFVTSHFDERTSEIVGSLQSNAPLEDGMVAFQEILDQRLAALDQRIEKIASAIEGQQFLIEQTQRIANSPGDDVSAKSVVSSTSWQSENPDEAGSHWSQQKAAMLSKYGIDPEHRPSMELPAPEPELEAVIEAAQNEELHDLQDLQNSIDEMSAEDTEHIDQLKAELTSKLRDAEVELSIQRAKLSQWNAELDQKKTELDRRTTQLEGKYEELSMATANSGPSLLERLKRHLNAKDRKNLDRM